MERSADGSLRYPMRTKLFALALAATLAIGASGVVAADAGSGERSAVQLPDEYGVDVTDSEDVLDDADVDRAIKTAWSDAAFRSYFETGEYVHFDVWAQGPNEDIHVSAGPSSDTGDDRVYATVDLDAGVVTEVDEPVRLNATSARTIELDGDTFEFSNGTDTSDDGTIAFEVPEDAGSDTDEEYDAKLTAEESLTVGLDLIDDAFGSDGVALYEMVGFDE